MKLYILYRQYRPMSMEPFLGTLFRIKMDVSMNPLLNESLA